MSEAQLIIAKSVLENLSVVDSYVVRQTLTELIDENKRLRANLINCAARLEAYYGEDYPAVRDAKAALTATSQEGQHE